MSNRITHVEPTAIEPLRIVNEEMTLKGDNVVEISCLNDVLVGDLMKNTCKTNYLSLSTTANIGTFCKFYRHLGSALNNAVNDACDATLMYAGPYPQEGEHFLIEGRGQAGESLVYMRSKHPTYWRIEPFVHGLPCEHIEIEDSTQVMFAYHPEMLYVVKIKEPHVESLIDSSRAVPDKTDDKECHVIKLFVDIKSDDAEEEAEPIE